MLVQRVEELTGPSGVRTAEVAEPDGEGKVVVEVEAAGVAFPDLLRAKGLYQIKSDPPFVLGGEAAGTVRQVPAGCDLREGQRVAVIDLGGTWQQVVAVDPGMALPLPGNVSAEVAAALPVNYLTCWFALRRRARARPGETVLVHGAAGGVGIAALDVCRALGLPTIAVVSDDRKAAAARAAGATDVVLTGGWRSSVAELTGGRGVDIVVDPVGGDRFTDSLRSLSPEGRVLVIGFAAGDIPTVKVNRLLLGNTAVVGVAWGEFLRTHPGYAREQWDELAPLLAEGTLAPLPPVRHAFADAASALRSLEDRTALGKIVLTMP
ncbi:NADPH:quinone oxidoreductase [Prauserella marina]|uniref:NADPH2:quinone reductase n=1 Tax=Prauserella marina TaxID=530584 RepID=A0A222VPY9_9PSEU|nr:NADPH:quinone oxidoreductase family protein [Prauserella marina]ASR35912.1 NADPH:quinone oxidoreductase [Prauserella marina]PWV84163.1 NADPH:quinone reductase-like Zn-dependent oxidoreductase [Prauserella marina]SDC29000.1 NADPH2:quinone reductase [Prauserella marina]